MQQPRTVKYRRKLNPKATLLGLSTVSAQRATAACNALRADVPAPPCDSQGDGDACAQLPREATRKLHAHALAGVHVPADVHAERGADTLRERGPPRRLGERQAMLPALPLPAPLPASLQPSQASRCQHGACEPTHIFPCVSICL